MALLVLMQVWMCVGEWGGGGGGTLPLSSVCYLSQLTCGSAWCVALQATKRIWAYIREHNLPSKKASGGKTATQLDDALASALKRKTITFASLAKCLALHMKDVELLQDAPKTAKGSAKGKATAAKGQSAGDSKRHKA